MGFAKAKYLKPDYSTKFFRSYYNYICAHHSKHIFIEICNEMGVSLQFLMSDGNWVSHEFRIEFLRKMKEKTGDSLISLKAGKAMLDAENINFFEYALLSALTPFLFYLMFPFSVSKANRRFKYLIKKARPGFFRYEIESIDGQSHDLDNCLAGIGFLRSPEERFKLGKLSVSHPECIHEGGGKCVFDVEYDAKRFLAERSIKYSIVVLLGAFIYFLGLQVPHVESAKFFSAVLVVTYLVSAFLMFFISKFWKIIKSHSVFYELDRAKDQDLYQSRINLDRRYQEIAMLRDLSLRLIGSNTAKDVLTAAVNDLETRFHYEKTIVMQVDHQHSKLYTVDVRGFSDQRDLIYKLNFKYPADKENPQIFAEILEAGDCTLIENLDEFKKHLDPQSQLLIMGLNVKNLIVAPIQDATNKYGVVIVGAAGGDKPLTADDKQLIESVTRMLGLFFQNARNFEKERILTSIFRKYVPPVVMDNIRLLENGNTGHLSPKNNAISSLFVDLRGFTSLSESLPPERIVDMLNTYIEYVTEYIAWEGGIVDNLVGDGIVAFFPARGTDRTEHARKALRSAIMILGNLDVLNERMKAKGCPSVSIGLGLHSGNATVGNFGTDQKMNYTAIGDTVNLASRLESHCKEYGDLTPSAKQGILVFSESVFNRAKLDVPRRELGRINVVGRLDSVMVYMMDKDSAKQVDIEKLAVLTDDEIHKLRGTQNDQGNRRATDNPKRKVG